MASCSNSSLVRGVAKGTGFSNHDDEELIEIVSRYEILWKLNHPDYKSNIKKDVIWNKIGLQLNKTGKLYVHIFIKLNVQIHKVD